MARVLVVDDEPALQETIARLLAEEGHEITTCGDGNEAKRLLADQDFDLLISDIRMTPVSGMELLKAANEVKPGLPVVMLTAYGHVDTAIEALELGAFDYIAKPFKVEKLMSVVSRALESGRVC